MSFWTWIEGNSQGTRNPKSPLTSCRGADSFCPSSFSSSDSWTGRSGRIFCTRFVDVPSLGLPGLSLSPRSFLESVLRGERVAETEAWRTSRTSWKVHREAHLDRLSSPRNRRHFDSTTHRSIHCRHPKEIGSLFSTEILCSTSAYILPFLFLRCDWCYHFLFIDVLFFAFGTFCSR